MNTQMLLEKVERLAKDYSGCVGVAIRSTSSDEGLFYNEDKMMSTASVAKVFVLGALLELCEKEEKSLEDMMTLQECDKVDGSGILLNMTPGMCVCVKDVATLMIIMSDNVATNMIIDYVGGVDTVNAHLLKHGILLTKVNRKITDDRSLEQACNFGDTSALELEEYLYLLVKGKILNSQYTNLFLSIMEKQHYKDFVTSEMPLAEYDDEKDQVVVCNKTGFMSGIRTDAGIIKINEENSYIYVVLTNECKDCTYAPYGEATKFMTKLGKEIYEAIKSDN